MLKYADVTLKLQQKMKAKVTILILLVAFLLPSVFADLSVNWISTPQPSYLGQNQTVAINVSNSGNVTYTAVFINVTGVNATYSTAPIPLAVNASAVWYVNLTTNRTTNYGSNNVYVTATGISGAVNATAESSASFDVLYRYCSTNSSDARVRVYEITNEDDIDSQEFSPLDELTVKVKVRNDYDEKRTAVVSAILVHKTSDIEETEVEKSIGVSSENYKTVSLNFTIPVDAENGQYMVYVKAYDDDSSKFCDQKYIKFSIDRSDTHRVIPYNIKINQENISCASSFIVSGTIGNIGSYDEEKVKLDYSDGWTTLSKTYSLDEGEETDFEFTSTAPKNATEGVHTFTLTTYYDYDDNDNQYGKSYANSYYSLLNIYGNCFKDISNASITPETASTQVFAGSQSELKILVSNTGTVKQTYTVDVPSVDWATVNSISPASFELEAGASRYVSIGITPSTNATIGNHTISAKVSYAGTSQTKSLTLSLQKVSQTGGLIEKIKFDVSRDWTWYLIGVFVIIIIWLIIAISSSANKSKSLEKALNEKKIRQYKNY
jgi:uncharacterized membrane protein